ncbi:MAG: hypothetical protein A2622_05540 [Bdellovibrionales bacterium RIFCSPHIGHO2_01_FULL_40_29]|nr:MAG: hypothetical protein A2622_05540 [Bdellovibrionales bacterium RIFCSPHIGHO2_01_FULL_40_29]OFZ33140.1 MAG: hypothetical protein A3D17_13330 [Bdellovibrionales bacterium RIFCSPHIGHO2_02_FULL_40_15]
MKLFIFSLFMATFVFAEDFPASTSSEAEFTKGFASDKGMQDIDHKAVEADRLKFGGSLQAEWQLYTLKNAPIKDVLYSPMTLELYLDSQLKDDVRAFFKGRMVHDASIDETIPSPLTGLPQRKTTSFIDEMNLRFQTDHKIFWTIGTQKIKWGAAKFWNPTDFINLQKRDSLRQDDLRAGISMLKAHIPWGDSNLYVIGVNENANESQQTGAAARFEIPFSKGEVSLSSYSRRGQNTKIGSDISFALGEFDLYVEAAESDTGHDKNISGGLTYEIMYSDDDSVIFGFESFWQENGTDDKTTYLATTLAGNYIPFYIGKKYDMASVFLTKPLSWNDSTFILNMVQNSSDFSQYYRLNWVYTGMSDATWTTAVGGRSGSDDSEMKFLGQDLDAMIQVKVAF